MVVGNPLQLRNINLPQNLKPYQTDINLSTKLKSLGVVFDENLTLKHQVTAVNKKAIGKSCEYCKNTEVYRQGV